MRRFVLFVAPLVPLMLAGCEDGPAQTFAPASGDLWNNGNSPAAVDDAGTSLTGSFGGTSKTEICSGGELQSQWSRMVEQPVVPPYAMGGIDISGINYAFLTVEQAENGINGALMPVPGAMNPPTRLCQGSNLGSGPNGGDVGGSLVTGWGDNNEMTMEWAVPTHKAYFMQLNNGYKGSMDWTYTTTSDMMPHKYHWQINSPITKDGTTYPFVWQGQGAQSPAFYASVDELYRGITSAFTPDLYDNLPDGDYCNTTGRCPIFPTGNDGLHPIIGFRTVSMYWDMGPASQPEPTPSIPVDAYFFNIKYAPYSFAAPYLKMDSIGPTASFNPIGNLAPAKDCELALNHTFDELMSNCISVFTDSAANTTAQAKVLGNLTHDDQNFTFSVVGLNQNYRPPELDIGGSRQFDIIHDNEMPTATALAVDYTLDVRANGGILNDRYPDASLVAGVYHTDYHGAGAVWREYGRLVQQDLAGKYAAIHGTAPKALHDPSCYFPMSCQGMTPADNAACGTYDFATCMVHDSVDTLGQVGDDNSTMPPTVHVGTCHWAPNFAPGQNASTWRAAPGCTGFETFITQAYPNIDHVTGKPPVAPDPALVIPAGHPYNAKAYPFPIDPNDMWDVPTFFDGDFNGGLRPGGPYGLWCLDPGEYDFCGAPSLLGNDAPLLDGSFSQTLQVLGQGDVNNLPPATGDYRYFFEFFTQAFAKYLQSGAAMDLGQKWTTALGEPAGAVLASLPYVHQPVRYFGDYNLNTDDFFFDSFGGNANKSEFIQYDFADTTHDPTGLNLEMLLIGSNLQEEHIYRRLDREERALFNAMENQDARVATQASWGVLHNGAAIVNDEWGNPIKNADMFITNIAGSPALGSLAFIAPSDASGNPIPWPGATPRDPCDPTNTAPMKTAEYCATHIDTDCLYPGGGDPSGGTGLMAPTDETGAMIVRANGTPLLSGYCGVFNGSPLALGSSNITLIDKDVPLEQQQLEQEAEVSVPIFDNPYDQTTNLNTLNVLVPWLPVQAGVGFPVASTGQNDVFVQTGELDFSGQVVVPVIDYLPVTVPVTDADGGLTGASTTQAQILAIESQDFLGDVFVCVDPVADPVRGAKGRPNDILTARMYTSAQEILTWIAAHPTAQDACGIIIRYSPYNNYPDYITSLANGVRLGIDQGAGFGRVTDLTLFVPGSGAPAPP